MEFSEHQSEESRPVSNWQDVFEWAKTHYRDRIFRKDEQIPTRPQLIYLVNQGAVRLVSEIQPDKSDTKISDSEDLVDTVAEQREYLLEAVAEYDESLMEKYFDDPDSLTAEEIRAALRSAVIDMSLIPMMCGTAFKNKGVQAVLDAVCAFMPSPATANGYSLQR